MQKTDLTSPLGLTIPFALNGDKSIPKIDAIGTDTSSLNLGFLPITQQPLDDGGVAPERIDFNGLFYLATDQRVFLQNGGFITFNSSVNSVIGGYPQDAILGYMDNSGNFGFVRSLKDNNQENFVADPTLIDGVNWEFVNLKNFDLLNPQFTSLQNAINTLDSSVVKLTGNQTVAGVKTFSSPVYVPNSTTAGTALRLVGKGGGYIKLGDGTLIQWGNEKIPGNNYSKSVSLYQSYASDVYRIFLTNTGTNNNAYSDLKVTSISSVSFQARSSTYDNYFNWLSIGQWY